jgi:3',5'-nucleoside bisphosphate phosphatase
MELTTTGLVLAPDASIDLQVHTVHSDGKWTPEELIDHLVSEGFGLAAITDHDRPDIAPMLQTLAREKGLPLLVAVEMTASWRGEMTDVLCYGFDPEHNALNEVGQDILHRQQDNTRMVFDNLRQQGFSFTRDGEQTDELAGVLALPSAQHPHAVVAVVKKYGYDTPEKSAGRLALEAGLQFETTEIATIVDAAHRSDAVALIAHPGRTDFITYDADLFDQLRAEVPIDGFEVYYPAHTPEQTAMYLDYAQKHGLLTSSGSDSHSADKKPIPYRAELSRALLELLGIQIK